MTTSRFQRWSQKKSEARQEVEVEPVTDSKNESELPPEEQELAINETLPEEEVLAKYDLPNPDAIELGTDIKGFMRKEIPEAMRRRALRSLWKSNPVLAVLDGLNDYDEDFTDAAYAGQVVQTLYKVGQGMFDRAAKAAETAAEVSMSDADNINSTSDANNASTDIDKLKEPPIEPHLTDSLVSHKLAGLTDISTEAANSDSEKNLLISNPKHTSSTLNGVGYFEPVKSLHEEVDQHSETAPKYRPRMRFDF